MKEIDMSERAVLSRLRQVDRLRDLCLSLMKATPLTDEEARQLRAQARAEKAVSVDQTTRRT